MKKRVIIIIVVALVIAGAITWRLVTNKQKINAKKDEVKNTEFAIPVNVDTVESKPLSGNLLKTGTLAPFEEASIMAAAPGQVVSLNFDLGTRVTAGQVIGRTDTKLKDLALQSAELSLKKLETDYKRYKELYEGGGVTEVNFKDIEYNYNNTKIQVEQSRKQLADAQIKAPISGVVTSKSIEVGEYVNPGNPLGTVVDISKLKVNVKVSENDVYQLREKDVVTITSPLFPEATWKGTVRFINPKGDVAHNYGVEIVMDNNKNALKAGTFVYVNFPQDTKESVIQVERSALPESVKNPYVYVVENGKAMKRKIVTGREIGDFIEVVDGLKIGELVITSGQINLNEGSNIEIVNQKK